MIKRKKGKLTSTNAQWKMNNYICSLSRNRDFAEKVKEIRKNFSLPKDGFEENLDDELAFISKLPRYTDARGDEHDFQKAAYDLASQFHLSVPWLDAITKYILYDDFFFTNTAPYVQMIDVSEILMEIEDLD